jgi:hypothetical protein
LKQVRACNIGQRLVVLEVTVGTKSAGVHDALRDTLVIEVKELLPKVEILERRGAALADLERVLIVCDGYSLLGRQDFAAVGGGLVGLAATATQDGAIAKLDAGQVRRIFVFGHVGHLRIGTPITATIIPTAGAFPATSCYV